MGEKMKERKTLWMRYVNFEKIKDLLHIVYKNNASLTAGELEKKGKEEEILLREDGKEMSHSPCYHYRKVMEGLGLVEVKEKCYRVSEKDKVRRLLQLTEIKKPMPEDAKEVLREIIVENEDCRKNFFDIFMKKNKYNLYELRTYGTYAMVKTKSMEESIESRNKRGRAKVRKKKRVGPIIIKNPTGKEIKLETQDSIHAIYWGVRLWSFELGLTDELMINFKEGRIIYPINTNFSENEITEEIIEKIKNDNTDNEWVSLYLPLLTKEIALKKRFAISQIKKFLHVLKRRYPTFITFTPSSTLFIDIKTPFERQDEVIRRLYLFKNGYFYSHLNIYKKFLKEVKL